MIHSGQVCICTILINAVNYESKMKVEITHLLAVKVCQNSAPTKPFTCSCMRECDLNLTERPKWCKNSTSKIARLKLATMKTKEKVHRSPMCHTPDGIPQLPW